MRFLIDAMFPPRVVHLLQENGREAFSPADLGAHNLPDEVLIEIAAAEGLTIVTENASDFAQVATCPVVFVRKSWWSTDTLASSLALALDRWSQRNPAPGPWPHWLDAEFRHQPRHFDKA